MVLGRRRDAGRTSLPPHNVPFTLIGARTALGRLVWIQRRIGACGGWSRGDCGDEHARSRGCGIGRVADDRCLEWGQATAIGGATGAVVGLVAITPAAGYVTPHCRRLRSERSAHARAYAAMQMRAARRIDDALDVFACHGVAGIVGALLTGVFASKAVNPGGVDSLIFGRRPTSCLSRVWPFFAQSPTSRRSHLRS